MMPMKNTLYKIGIGVCLPIILFHSELKSQAGTGPAPYCMPAYSQTPCNQPNISNDPLNFINDFVNDFNTAGAVTNITNNNSGCNSQLLGGLTENYFRTSCPTFLRVNPGQVITVNVRSGITFDQGFAVFVDWNNNGVYAMPGEQVCATPGIPIGLCFFAVTQAVKPHFAHHQRPVTGNMLQTRQIRRQTIRRLEVDVETDEIQKRQL